MFEWNRVLETGYKDIDDQHRELLAAMSSYFEKYKMGIDRDGLVETMNYLVEYVKRHFSTEEHIMTLTDYADIDRHKKAHREMTETLVVLYRRLINGADIDDISSSLLDYLQDWFISHLNNYDKKLAVFLSKKKVELA